jgi:hypothetical protein
MQLSHFSERSRQSLKPKFLRLDLMRRRRKDDEVFYDSDLPNSRRPTWYCTADEEGMVQIRLH